MKLHTTVTQMNGTKRLTIKRALAEILQIHKGDTVVIEVLDIKKKV